MIPTIRVAIECVSFLETLAPDGVSNADGEEEQCRPDVDQIGVSRGEDANANQEADDARYDGSFFHNFYGIKRERGA
jgi:hypothetical protein